MPSEGESYSFIGVSRANVFIDHLKLERNNKMNREDSIEEPTICMVRVKRGNVWYDQRPLGCFVARSKRIIERLRQMGKEIRVVWLTGMGLET